MTPSARLLKFVTAAGAVWSAVLAGCQQQSLWGGAQAPTQYQTHQMDRNGFAVPYYDLNDGDSEDPSVDQGNFPDTGGEPWWNSPGYIGG